MRIIERAFKKIDRFKENRKLLPIIFFVMLLILTSCTGSLQKNTLKDSGTGGDNAKSQEDVKSLKNEFSLKDVEGNVYKLSSDSGKKVYIKFWATWCSICLAGLDELTQFTKDKENDKNVDIITIVSPGVKGEMSTKDFIEWYEKQGYQFKVLLDEGGNVARQFGIRGYPTSVFIDTKGEIANTRVGHLANSGIDSVLKSIK